MQVQTKFLWLSRLATMGEDIDGWLVSWIGGWDRCRVFLVVKVVKEELYPFVLSKARIIIR